MIAEPGRFYANIKTGEPYKLLRLATAAWDINQKIAVYESFEGTAWVRSLTEFMEKFKEAGA